MLTPIYLVVQSMSLSSSTLRKKPGGFREFLAIAYPLVISNLSLTLMNFVDRLMLSWSSPEEIAACIPAGILTWALLAVFIGISEYTNVFVAQFYGANQHSSIGAATWQGIFFSIVCGLLCLFLQPLGIRIFDLAGHSADITVYEKEYFSILFSGGTFIILKESLSSFYSGRGKTKVVMLVNIFANLVNAVLAYFLIFGFGKIPAMGIRGAALATLFSLIFACIAFFMLFLSPANAQKFHTRAAHFNLALMKRMIRFGTPAGVQFFLEIGSYTAFVFIIGKLGKIELAASNIALSINSLAFLPMLGAGIATATLVGQYIGRKDFVTAEKCAYTALIAVEAYMMFFALIYVTIPDFLLTLFQGDTANSDVPFSEIQHYGRLILILIAVYQIGDAMNITFSGALRGAGDTTFAMWANIFSAWMFFVPGTWLTIMVFKKGLIGAWCWASAYILILGSLYWLRFRSCYWKTIRMIPVNPDEE